MRSLTAWTAKSVEKILPAPATATPRHVHSARSTWTNAGAGGDDAAEGGRGVQEHGAHKDGAAGDDERGARGCSGSLAEARKVGSGARRRRWRRPGATGGALAWRRRPESRWRQRGLRSSIL
uniref:Uncharacterized protein n=1 Tax=Arundo donax TaxID=35708 RepID=A0A0A8YZP0_ARUDO